MFNYAGFMKTLVILTYRYTFKNVKTNKNQIKDVTLGSI